MILRNHVEIDQIVWIRIGLLEATINKIDYLSWKIGKKSLIEGTKLKRYSRFIMT